MYICRECHNTFEYPFVCYDDMLEHFGTPCHTIVNLSPCCKSDFVETFNCDLCGQPVLDDYISLENGQCICSYCYSKHNILDG